jgi:hypothetical protein
MALVRINVDKSSYHYQSRNEIDGGLRWENGLQIEAAAKETAVYGEADSSFKPSKTCSNVT